MPWRPSGAFTSGGEQREVEGVQTLSAPLLAPAGPQGKRQNRALALQVRELKNLKAGIEEYKNLENLYEEIEVLIELGYEEEDRTVLGEIENLINELGEKLDEVKTKTLLSGPYDSCSAIGRAHV